MTFYEQNAAPASGENTALTVSSAMALAKGALESVNVTIVGEVSEVSVKAGYKAAYFTVKDERASLPCLMWNNRYRTCGVQLAVGQLVEITGRFSLYAAKGRMNFDVSTLRLSGEGNLRLQVANIARKLQAEGLTDPARKRPLPAFPDAIGLVTSPRSAAVHDVLRTLRRRFPLARVNLAGVPVEGAGAAAGIAEGIGCVVRAGSEVVLVVRGGGSFEDLMPFNDESLARTIAACPVPVVTGIGHEVDTTIADMVSDLRASTPTAAAEAVSPSPESLSSFFESRTAALARSVAGAIDARRNRLGLLANRPMFTDPMGMFASEAIALDNASERLARACPENVSRLQSELSARASRLAVASPVHVSRLRSGVDALETRLAVAGPKLFDTRKLELAGLATRLDDLSPLATVARGYSITRDSSGAVVRDVAQAPVGSAIEVDVANGTLACEVKATTLRSNTETEE